MDNSIKKILDYLKREDKNNLGFNQDKLLSYQEGKLLLDYITNLQQKYDEAIKQSLVDHKYASKKEDEVIELQQENERLKEEKIMLLEEIVNIKNNIEEGKLNTATGIILHQRQIEFENINKIRYEDYKSRNEKAIEYIKEHQRKDEFLELNEWGTRDLLNILQGSDNNE